MSALRLAARPLWLTLATVSLGVGAVGIVVPVLPTTPFVLVAAYAAARSSARLHAWILRHRFFGAAVRDWTDYRAVSRGAKTTASATMAVSAIVLFVASPSSVLAAATTVFMAAVGAWLWRRPEPPGRS